MHFFSIELYCFITSKVESIWKSKKYWPIAYKHKVEKQKKIQDLIYIRVPKVLFFISPTKNGILQSIVPIWTALVPLRFLFLVCNVTWVNHFNKPLSNQNKRYTHTRARMSYVLLASHPMIPFAWKTTTNSSSGQYDFTRLKICSRLSSSPGFPADRMLSNSISGTYIDGIPPKLSAYTQEGEGRRDEGQGRIVLRTQRQLLLPRQITGDKTTPDLKNRMSVVWVAAGCCQPFPNPF